MTEPVIVPPRRSLTRRQRVKLFDAHGGICGGRDWQANRGCGGKIAAGEPWIDEHINPREISADDSAENRRPFHVKCAAKKTKTDRRAIDKTLRMRAKHLGLRKGRRMRGGRGDSIKIKLDGTIVSRATGEVIRRRA